MRLDFSVAVHSLLYLDQNRDRRIASRELAQSLSLNPVMIRNILSLLHKKMATSKVVLVKMVVID